MPVIRLSKATFPQEIFSQVETMLVGSEKVLKPAVLPLNGCLQFYVGIDPVSNSMAFVSIWESLSDAKQMDTLAPMIQLGVEFTEIGVHFDRPIINFPGVWNF
jgi:hypothetical protein